MVPFTDLIRVASEREPARPPLRRIGVCIISIGILGCTGCASAPRGQAALVADKGLGATTTLSADLRNLGDRLSRGDSQSAFERTWVVCRDAPAACEPKTVAPETRAARAKLFAAIAARAKAVDALHGAYLALQSEAAYDGRTDLESAVGLAWKQVDAYAALVGAPATSVAAVGRVATLGAGIFGEQRQRQRLLAAHVKLAAAVKALRVALAQEQSTFESIATAVVDDEVLAQDALLESRLVSAVEFARPIAEGVGVPLSKGAETILAQPGPALTSTRAAAIEGAERRKAEIRSRYAIGLAALGELEALHEAAANDQPLVTDRLQKLLAELEAVSVAIKPTEGAAR